MYFINLFVLIFIVLLFKVLSRVLSPNVSNENKMYETNFAIPLKPMNEVKKISKLKILPSPIKPIFNATISSQINNALINNKCKYYFENVYLKLINYEHVKY